MGKKSQKTKSEIQEEKQTMPRYPFLQTDDRMGMQCHLKGKTFGQKPDSILDIHLLLLLWLIQHPRWDGGDVHACIQINQNEMKGHCTAEAGRQHGGTQDSTFTS